MSEVQEQNVGSTQETPPSMASSVATGLQSTSENSSSEAISASISASSSVSIKPQPAVRPSALPKPSGLKPPTKIGRLCSNTAPKPAVPQSPRGDGGSSDAVRKLSDELSRKHLSDLIEEDEVTSTQPERLRSHRKASTSSTFSGTSMDALWEKHPRRLSEAGLRRSSDHSVILTEDTDSFIIGDRVWVGGTKSGQIAYIGETQFAPGDWAGIVLDDPIGKNDGSVGGVRYFQCAEKRGVFSRLSRLTRVPLFAHGHDMSPVSDAGSVFERPPSAYRPRRTLSPNGSVRSALSSRMNASISTGAAGGGGGAARGELCLGDRVIVSSSRGSKAGALRYVGPADFAPGTWAGVELDDPLGKNDGSVDGRRYFDCAPRFGLFAPISKVSRSPSNRKPGTCAIHNNGRVTPLRRSNSRDSLTSLGTSVASSRLGGPPRGSALSAQRYSGPRASSTPVSAKNAALQELLREKQSHLERLMKERDLERAEVAKITLQADRSGDALTLLQKEAKETSVENARLKSELDQLNKQLEDERQRVEDLMFRNEEENINKEDYQKYRDAMEKEKEVLMGRVRELEAAVSLEAARAAAAAAAAAGADEQRAADLAAMQHHHADELSAAQTLSTELQKLLDEAYALLREKEYEKDSLNKSMSEELSKVRAESERALNEARTKLAIAQTEFETQVSVISGKLQLAESKLETEKTNVERLNKENCQTVSELNARVSQLQAALDDKTHELNKVHGTNKEHELNLNKEITKLKMEISAKVLDLENSQEAQKKQDIILKTLQEEFDRVRGENSQKVSEYETLLNEVTQNNDKNKTLITKLQQDLEAKTKEYDQLMNESNSTSSSTEKLVLEYKQRITERDKEIVKLKDEYEQATANFNKNHSKIAEEHQKEIEERNIKIDSLLKEIDSFKNSINQNNLDLNTLRTQFTINEDELKLLKEENVNLKKSLADLTQANTDLKAKLAEMELEVGELTRLLSNSKEKCEELQKAKTKAEEEYLNLTGQATDSNEQFNKLSQLLKTTEQELQDLKDKNRESINAHARVEQELKQQLFKLQEDFSLERIQLVKSADETNEKLKASEVKASQLEVQVTDTKTLLEELQNNRDQLMDENDNLKKDVDALKARESELKLEHENISKEMEKNIEKYKQEVGLLKAEGASSEVKLMEKVDQLIEAQNDLNNKLEEARRHEDALQKVIDDMTATLNNQKTQFEQEIVALQTHLSTATEDVSRLKSEEARLKELYNEKENSLKELTLKLEMLEVDLKSNIEIAREKDKQLALISEELNHSNTSKKQIEEKLNNTNIEMASLRQQYDNLIANSSVEESLLKEQQTQVENLKKEITIAKQEKITIEGSLAAVTDELGKLKTLQSDTEKKLQDTEANCRTLQQTLSEKEAAIKTLTVKADADALKIKTFDSDLDSLKQELSSKTIQLNAKDTELKTVLESLEKGNSESQHQTKALLDEVSKLKENHKNEIDTLNKQCKDLQARVVEQENQLVELEKSKSKINEMQESLTKSENDIKQLTNINEGQKSNYEELNSQLQKQCDEYKKECKIIKSEFKTKLADFESETKNFKEKLQAELNKQEELQAKLVEAEKNVIELKNQLELVTVQNSSNVDKDEKLEKLTLDLQSLRKLNAETMQNSEIALNKLKTEVDCKVKDLKEKENLLSKLQTDIQNQKARLEIAEREKALLQKELSTKTKDVSTKDTNDNTTSEKEIIASPSEDKEVIEGQVSFLNSVIVDMQRKNEKLIARVQALEGGLGRDEPPLFNGRKPRAVAPRLFCDICDVFDAHDTEECPRQAQGEPLSAPPQRNPPPPPREYCDICEVFGHSTENCDEEETF